MKRTDILHSDEGFTLVGVLVFLAIIAFVVSITSANSLYQVRLANHHIKYSQSKTTLIGASQQLMNGFQQFRKIEKIDAVSLQTWKQCRYFNDKIISFRLLDHDGLIDINAASYELLLAGFQALSFNKDDAGKLANRVLDYRDRNQISNEGGIENNYFSRENGGSVFGVKNAPFNSLEELDQLPGFELIEYPNTYSIFTVQTGLGGIDIKAANDELKKYLKNLNTNFRAARGLFFSMELFVKSKIEPRFIIQKDFQSLGNIDPKSRRSSTRILEYQSEFLDQESLKHNCASDGVFS